MASTACLLNRSPNGSNILIPNWTQRKELATVKKKGKEVREENWAKETEAMKAAKEVNRASRETIVWSAKKDLKWSQTRSMGLTSGV